MILPCRFLALCAVAAAPALAAAQSAPLKADGAFRYALGGGGSYASGWTGTLARANVGGEGVIATTDSRLRFGAKALWSRMIGETASTETTTLLFSEEWQQRWRGNTWFRQKLSLVPALRTGESARGIVETGIAMAMSPFCSVSVGLTQHYEADGGLRAGDALFTTAIAFKLR